MFLQLKGLKKIYEEEKGLKNLDLEIEEGSFVTLLGPSGCGKTTTLNLLGGFIQPDSGHILLEGEDITGLPPERRPVSTVFQSYALFPHLNVLDNVELPLLYRKSTEKSRRETARAVLEKVGLSHRTKHFPSQLSGGQCQRVAIARALIGNPKIILADEPTGNLDSKTGEEIMRLLFELNREGTTIVMVTHDEHMARKTQRIVRFFDGRRIE